LRCPASNWGDPMVLDRNRSHGKIDNLPLPMKQQVDERLLAGQTYEAIADWLNEQGEEIHLSSVGRYGKKFLKKFEEVRIAKDFAKILAEDNVERPTTELHEANNMLMSQILMEALVDGSMDPKQRLAAAKAIASLQQAQVSNERLKITARKEAGSVHTAMSMLKEKVFEEIAESHPDIAQALVALAEQTEAEMEKQNALI